MSCDVRGWGCGLRSRRVHFDGQHLEGLLPIMVINSDPQMDASFRNMAMACVALLRLSFPPLQADPHPNLGTIRTDRAAYIVWLPGP